MVCYKYPTQTPDPVAPTYRWRDPPNNRPENALLGVMYIGRQQGGFWEGFDWVTPNASDPVFANTGLTNGAALRQLVGYEWDGVVNNGFSPPGLKILGASPVTPATVATGIPKTATQISHSTRYTHASGCDRFDSLDVGSRQHAGPVAAGGRARAEVHGQRARRHGGAARDAECRDNRSLSERSVPRCDGPRAPFRRVVG